MNAFPEVVQGGGPIDGFFATERKRVEELIASAGAVLFRGFEVSGAGGFERAAIALSPGLDDYRRGISPRKQVAGRVYTSTEVAARYPIPMHCELAYAVDPPRRVLFHCQRAAAAGGETPLADARKVYRRVHPTLRDRLEAEGVVLRQTFAARDGLRAGWRTVFAAEGRGEVERSCAANGIAFEWLRGDRLRLELRGPAVIHHPRSGEPVWFNNLLVNHDHYSRVLWRMGLRGRAAVLRAIELSRPARLRPFDCFFGDGERVPAEALAHLRAAFEAETVRVPWQEGDVLALDNLAVAHGREPYRGARDVRVVLLDRAPLA